MKQALAEPQCIAIGRSVHNFRYRISSSYGSGRVRDATKSSCRDSLRYARASIIRVQSATARADSWVVPADRQMSKFALQRYAVIPLQPATG